MGTALSSLPAAARVLAKPLDGHLNVMIHKSGWVEVILLKSNGCFDCQSTLCPESPATSQLKMAGNSRLALSLPVSNDKTRQNSTEIHSFNKKKKKLTAVYSAQEPGFKLSHLVVQDLVPATMLTTITQSFREHSQIIQHRLRSLPPCCDHDLQPKTHSPGWLL